jgi:hypothetical protein
MNLRACISQLHQFAVVVAVVRAVRKRRVLVTFALLMAFIEMKMIKSRGFFEIECERLGRHTAECEDFNGVTCDSCWAGVHCAYPLRDRCGSAWEHR